tara:strand:- start:1192 stop:1836 length:645 start_codon:yes stop_codon:yes gene_type:complete
MALSKFEYNSFDVTPVASNAFAFNSTPNGLTTAASGAMTLLTTNTITSGVSSSSFTSSIDSTYDTYLFKFINIHPASDQKNFTVNFRDGGSDFDATKTTTMFLSNHEEGDSYAAISYMTSFDLAQSTSYQPLTENTGGDNDQGCTGDLFLFSPSSTTFIKHFIARTHNCRHADAAELYTTAGYCNVTAAIDGVDFKFSSGNIDSGVIKMYGVTK